MDSFLNATSNYYKFNLPSPFVVLSNSYNLRNYILSILKIENFHQKSHQNRYNLGHHRINRPFWNKQLPTRLYCFVLIWMFSVEAFVSFHSQPQNQSDHFSSNKEYFSINQNVSTISSSVSSRTRPNLHHHHHHHHRHRFHHRWPHHFRIISRLKRTEFNTEPTIFPCLDFFNVKLSWIIDSLDQYSNEDVNRREKQTDEWNENERKEKQSSSSDYNQNNLFNEFQLKLDRLNEKHFRPLLRLYWTDKDSMQRINESIESMRSMSVSNSKPLSNRSFDRWRSKSHHRRKNLLNQPQTSSNRIEKNNEDQFNSQNIVDGDDELESSLSPSFRRSSKSIANYFPSNRFSTLIELSKLHYVKEYSIRMRIDDELKIGCDSFKPKSNIFYCFVYLILYKSAVLFENLPHCVPTTAIHSIAPSSAPALIVESSSMPYGLPSRLINNVNQFVSSIGSTMTPAVNPPRLGSIQIKFNYDEIVEKDSRNPSTIDSSRSLENISYSMDKIDNEELTKDESSGPAYKLLKQTNSLLSEPDEHSMTAKSILKNSHDESAQNSTVFRLKNLSRNMQRICSCRRDWNIIHSHQQKSIDLDSKIFIKEIVPDDDYDAEGVLNNSNDSILIKLIIISCSKLKNKHRFNPLYSFINDRYFPDEEWSEFGDDLKSEELEIHNDDQKHSVHRKKADDGKNSRVESGKISQLYANYQSIKSPSNKKVKQRSSKSLRLSENKPSKSSLLLSSSSSLSTSDIASATKVDNKNYVLQPNPFLTSSTANDEEEISGDGENNPTVCIVSIANAEQYLFEIENIEPTINWLSENPSLAKQYHYNSEMEINDPIDSFHKFPFLIIRNGRSSIDPQLNIDSTVQDTSDIGGENHYSDNLNGSSKSFVLQNKFLRFEAFTSMNLTIKLTRKNLFRKQSNRNQSDNVQAKSDESSNDFYYSTGKFLRNVSNSLWLWLMNVVATLASKLFAINLVQIPMIQKYFNDQSRSSQALRQIRSDRGELLQMNMVPFHFIAMLLSIFIVMTIVIYIIIALNNQNYQYPNGNNNNNSNPINNGEHSHRNDLLTKRLFNEDDVVVVDCNQNNNLTNFDSNNNCSNEKREQEYE
ncbi:multidrug resistance-associated protein 4 [Sarcoptes scabiei]|nr:multidrug resistance-associated protein 4 [Sarcoptes scabiei]